MSVDLHCHILPGIDDGAGDMETSLEMLRIAEKDGIEHIIATPHYIKGEIDNGPSIVREKYEELKQALVNGNINVKVYPGNEVYISPDIPELMEDRLICPLNDTSYVLVEFPMSTIPLYAADVFYQLRLKGFNPILAHPERNGEIVGDPNILFDLVQSGVLVQINAASLTGFYGRKVEETAWSLLRHGMAHFVATDAHSQGRRAPKLSESRKAVESEFGEAYAKRLYELNGLAVLSNERIEHTEPKKITKRKHFLFPSLSRFRTK